MEPGGIRITICDHRCHDNSGLQLQQSTLRDPILPTLNAHSPTKRRPWSVATEYYATGRLGTAILLLACFALWTVTGRYWGLQHDAQAYAVQALAKFEPEIFAGDLFLRFQSQDDFTLFPYLAAWAIEWLGLDHGAAVLTFAFFAGWMLVCWRLARALAGPDLARLAIGLLLVIPGWYGAGMVFRTAEPFLSARPAAEILCLGALLSFVNGRRPVAAGLVVLAIVVHPIMALPVALALLGLSMPWRESRRFWPIAALACCLGSVMGSFVIGGSSPLMAEDWLQMTRMRSNYLFPHYWLTSDWQANAIPLLSVLLASQLLDGWSQRLARAAFWVATCGLVLAALAGTVVPLTLLLQGQPWRWVWPCSVLAIILLPGTVAAAWRHAPAGRAVALLICTAWLLGQWSSADQVPPIGVAGLLLACALALWWARNRLRPPMLRAITAGAAIGLLLTLVGVVMSAAAVFAGRFDFGTDPLWVQTTADVLQLVAAGVCVVTAAWWFTIRSWTPVGGAVVGLAAATLALAALPGAVKTWVAESYSTHERQEFSDWRRRIPTDAEVLWPDGLQETWFLLGRRSYLTVSQLGGIVFSAEVAREARRRAEVLAALVPPGHWFIDPSAAGTKPAALTATILFSICVPGGPGFVVDDEDLGIQVAAIEWPTRAKFRYLYDCATVRPGPNAGRLAAPVTDLPDKET